MKTMDDIRFYHRSFNRWPSRNPTISGQACILELVFHPFFTESGEKMVNLTRIEWTEKVESVKVGDSWETKITWDREITRSADLTPDEANKQWLLCKSKKYMTQKVPAELAGLI